MLHVDVKFANAIGYLLRNYKKKSDYLWNFSCPICGDSKTVKTKARAYIYKIDTSLCVRCHNCDYNTNLANFLKALDANIHAEYVREKYQDRHRRPISAKPVAPPIVLMDDVLSGTHCLKTLEPNHPAVKYITSRKLPSESLDLLYYVSQFKKYINTLLPGKFANTDNDTPRLLIPFFDQHGMVHTLTGRAFGPEEPKYLTLKLHEDATRIYGLDRVDYSKRVYVVEGPLDSLCIPNAIAVSGSSFATPTVEAIKAIATICYDNEPRSPEICALLKKTISKGYTVCIWPDGMVEKDINDVILSGKTPQEITDLIDNNTFGGARASIRFNTWKRC